MPTKNPTTKTKGPKAAHAPKAGKRPHAVEEWLSATDLLNLARQVFGTQKAAAFWMERPNPELAGAAPKELVTDGRAQIVKDFLEGILAGSYG